MKNRGSKFGQSYSAFFFPSLLLIRKVGHQCSRSVPKHSGLFRSAEGLHSARALWGSIWFFAEVSGRCLQPWVVSGLPLGVLWGLEKLSFLLMQAGRGSYHKDSGDKQRLGEGGIAHLPC